MMETVVLMSVYKKDCPEYLRIAINSILNQTYQDFILLIGVDGEVDDSLNVVLNEFEGNSKIAIKRFLNNRGLTAVLNDLISIGSEYSPTYYARMDADDISESDRLKKQIAYLEDNPSIDIIGGAIALMDYYGEEKNKIIKYPITHEDCYKFFATRNPLAHPAVVFRKSFFKKSGFYNTKYRKNQDTEMWYRGFMNGCKFANIEDVVLHFRESDDMFQRRGGVSFAKEILTLRNEINKNLGYGITATIFGYCYFLMAISPGWVKKILYKLR